MKAKYLFALLVALATFANAGGMFLVEPWIITMAVEGAAVPLRHMFGYALITSAAALCLAATFVFSRWRAWKFFGASHSQKAVYLLACSVVTIISLTMSLAAGLFLGQIAAQL